MKVKNKRGFIVGIMTVILGGVSLIIYGILKEQRFLISSILLVALSLFNFYNAFSKKGILEELQDNVDERDLYLTMKTSHILVKITNYILCTFTFLFVIAYGAWKVQYFLVISMTLCAVIVFMFLAYLFINVYLEKKE